MIGLKRRRFGMAVVLIAFIATASAAQDSDADFLEQMVILVIREKAALDLEWSKLEILSTIREELDKKSKAFHDNRDELVGILEVLAGEGLFADLGKRLPDKPFYVEVHKKAVALLKEIGGGNSAALLARLAREFPVLPATKVLEDFDTPSGWIAFSEGNAGGIRVTAALRPVPLPDPGLYPQDGTVVRTPGKSALGIKMEFLAVRDFTVSISPAKPLPVPFIKSLGIQVYGNNSSHALWLKLVDTDGAPVGEVYWNKFNFIGWKKLDIVIPQEIAGLPLAVAGFEIRCNPLELHRGTLYFYFDDLTAVTLGARP